MSTVLTLTSPLPFFVVAPPPVSPLPPPCCLIASAPECSSARGIDAALELLSDTLLATMTATTQSLGLLGERIAEHWLVSKGWSTLGRRVRSGHRDLDLVMEREGVVAFVEVKARSGERFGDPVEAVHWKKRRELVRSALVWMDRNHRPEHTYRFDVVGVLVSDGRARIRHVPAAFDLGFRY